MRSISTLELYPFMLARLTRFLGQFSALPSTCSWTEAENRYPEDKRWENDKICGLKVAMWNFISLCMISTPFFYLKTRVSSFHPMIRQAKQFVCPGWSHAENGVDDVCLLSWGTTLYVEIATMIAYSYYTNLATGGHPATWPSVVKFFTSVIPNNFRL